MPLLAGVIYLASLLFYQSVDGLDNGLALTPPMGWSTWQRFRCITDCKMYPKECISESLIKRTAETLVDDGYLDAGYKYVVIDDCWLEKERSPEGYLRANRTRFPCGMRSLADFVHSKGLKFGIYQNYGNKTCAGYPGLYGHLKEDISLLTSWNIDYLKVDGCYYSGDDYPGGYAEIGKYLNDSGRPIVYSCSYPAYQEDNGIPINYNQLVDICNLWRNFEDIDDSWESLTYILDYFALKQGQIRKVAGPGHWNDPDMLLIGNYGLSYDQSKVQMALWAILAAPLILSADLDQIKPEFKSILLNKAVIEVNQDPLGIQGGRVYKSNKIEVWVRRVTPVVDCFYSYAIAVYSKRTDGAPYRYKFPLSRIGLRYEYGYEILDLFEMKLWRGVYFPATVISVRVNPTSVVFLKATVRKQCDDDRLNQILSFNVE